MGKGQELHLFLWPIKLPVLIKPGHQRLPLYVAARTRQWGHAPTLERCPWAAVSLL